MVLLWALCLGICFSNDVYCQGAKFTVESPEKVRVSTIFDVSFTLENAEGDDFRAPDFSDFEVIAGPNREQSFSMINGVTSRQSRFSFRVKPLRTGSITIPSAQIRVDGKILKTPLKTILVEKDETTSAVSGAKGDYFFILEASEKKAYVGQQILLKYYLFYRTDIQGISIERPSNVDGFLSKQLDPETSQEQVTVGGKVYVKRNVHTLSIFPQRTGQFEITGAVFGVELPSEDPRDGFGFFRRMGDRKLVGSNGVTIYIQSLPQPTPEGFIGAVGDYSAELSLTAPIAKRGSGTTLLLTIEGDGFPEPPLLPKLESTNEYEVYEPNHLNTELFVKGDRLGSRQQYSYDFVPKVGGDIAVQPKLLYFDTKSESYLPVGLSAKVIQVKESVSNSGPVIDEEATQRYLAYRPWYRRPWVLFSVVALILGGIFLVYRQKSSSKESDQAVADLKWHQANKVALSKLSHAQKALQQQDRKLFYKLTLEALNGYLGDKFHLAPVDQEKENIRKVLSETLVPSIAEEYTEVIATCELFQYAGVEKMPDQSLFDRAKNLIIQIEQSHK